MHSLYGAGLDRIWRGCGSLAVISGVWQFLCRNKEHLKSQAVNILCWSGHVAIVDWVWKMLDDKTVHVDICQSSRAGRNAIRVSN